MTQPEETIYGEGGNIPPALYDFNNLQFDAVGAYKSLTDVNYLGVAFNWNATQQGYEYWDRQYKNGLDFEARTTISLMIEMAMVFANSVVNTPQ